MLVYFATVKNMGQRGGGGGKTSAENLWGQFYKTLQVTNFCNNLRAFVPDKLFQPSPMFEGMAKAYPSEATFRFSTLG